MRLGLGGSASQLGWVVHGAEDAWVAIEELPGPPGPGGTVSGCVVIERTTDGGAHWSRVMLRRTQVTNLCDWSLSFADARHGWFLTSVPGYAGCAAPAELFTTSDGGKRWSVVARSRPGSTSSLPGLGPAVLSAPGTGWLLGPSRRRLYRSRDGGRSWAPVRLPAPGLPGGAVEGIIGLPRLFGEDGYVRVSLHEAASPSTVVALYTTQDGGRSWRYVPPPRLSPGTFVFADARHLWFWSVAPQLGREPVSGTYTGVACNVLDAPRGVPVLPPPPASPVGTLFRSTDGGRRWTPLPTGDTQLAALAAVTGTGVNIGFGVDFDFVSPAIGWALAQPVRPQPCRGPVLLHTADGGRTWARLPLEIS